MKKITIKCSSLKGGIEVECIDNPAANKIIESLPIESTAQTWGDEIYFDTGITAPAQGATIDVSIGDVAYWPEGKCLCIFFGKTPMSTDEKPVPASEVVIIGRTTATPDLLRKAKAGSSITVS